MEVKVDWENPLAEKPGGCLGFGVVLGVVLSLSGLFDSAGDS